MAENLVKYKVRAKIDGRDVEITLSAPEGTSEDELRATIQNVTPEELTSLMTSQEVVGPPEPVPEREPGFLPDQYTFGIPQMRHDLRTGRSAEKWGPETRTPPSEHEPEYRLQTDDPNLTHGPTPMRPQPLATRAVPSEGWQFLTNQPFLTGLAEGASLGTLGHIAGLKGGVQNVAGKLLTEFPPITAKTEPGAIQFETPAAKYLRELGEGWSEGYRGGRDTYKKPIRDNPIRGTLGEVSSAFFGGYPLASVGRHAMERAPQFAEKISDVLNLPKGAKSSLKEVGRWTRGLIPRSVKDTIVGAGEGAVASALMGDLDSMGTNAELGGLIGGGTALLTRPLQDAAGRVMTLFQSPASRSAQTLRDALRFTETGEQTPPKAIDDPGIPQRVLRRGSIAPLDYRLANDPEWFPSHGPLSSIPIGEPPATSAMSRGNYESFVDRSPELQNLLHDALGFPGSGREFAKEQLIKRQAEQGERLRGLSRGLVDEDHRINRDSVEYKIGKNFLKAPAQTDFPLDRAVLEKMHGKEVNDFYAGVDDRINELVDSTRMDSNVMRHFETPLAERNMKRVFGEPAETFIKEEKRMADTYDELRKVMGSSAYRAEPIREHLGFAAGRDILMPTQYSRYALGHALAKGGRDERKRATYDRISRMLTQRVPIVDPRWKPQHPDSRKKPLKYMFGDFMKGVGPEPPHGDPYTVIGRDAGGRHIFREFGPEPSPREIEPEITGGRTGIMRGPIAIPGALQYPVGYSGNPLETFIPPSETLYRHSSGGAGMLFNPLWRDAEGLPISETRAINRFVVPAALAGAGYPGAARIWTLGRVMKRAADAESDESGE